MLSRKVTTHWTLDGKRVKAHTPGATKVTVKSGKWYGRVGGVPTPLHSNKSAALQMLAGLRREHEERSTPFGKLRQEGRRSLAEHIEEFLAEVADKPGPKGATGPAALANVRRALDGALEGMTGLNEITYNAVRRRLAEMAKAELLPEPELEFYLACEAAAVIGQPTNHLCNLVRRHRLPTVPARGDRPHGRRLYPAATVTALLALQRPYRGLSAPTLARTVSVLRRFTRWLVRRGKLATDPLAELAVPGAGQRCRQRRALTDEEAGRLLTATLAGGVCRRRLDAASRHALYLTALSTGFRRNELASLTPESFTFTGSSGVVRLARKVDKAGRAVVQPLPAQAVATLRRFVESRPSRQPLWPGGWRSSAAEMLRGDLEAAGVAYIVQGPDGPLYADFHALRHTYIAMLDRAGLTLKQAMQLARHSDPRLTAATYGRANAEELAACADRICLPACLPASLAPVGSK